MIKRHDGFRDMAAFRMAATLAAFLLTGCGDPTEPPKATSISLSPTSVSLVYVGETATVAATVTDQRRQSFEGTVSWTSSDTDVFTVDAGGVVTAVANGTGTLRASVADLAAEAAVTVQQVADSVAILSGSGQRAIHGSMLPDTVVVRVLDGGGTPVAEVTVNFEPGGGGSADPPSAQTDADGRAATSWTLGPATGVQSLAASVPNGPSAEASATALVAADSIEFLSGESRRVAPGHTLPVEVLVVDKDGEPVSGLMVNFAPGQEHGTASPASVATGEDGLAATVWTLGEGSAPQRLAASIEYGPASASTAAVVAPAAVRAMSANPEGASGRPAPVSAQLVAADEGPLEGSLRFETAQGHGTVDVGDGPASSATVRTDTTGTVSVQWTPMGDVAGQPVQRISVSVPGSPGVQALEIDLRITSGICYRTQQVVEDLVFKLSPDPNSPPKHCADVTIDDLDSTPNMGQFVMVNVGLESLKSWDFAGIDVTLMLLNQNQLAELPPGVFAGLPNLFSGLPNLSALSLTENRLTASAFAEIRELRGLKILDMSSNPLGEIPEGALDNFSSLELLSLQDMGLRTVPANAFRNLSNLVVLLLAQNDELRTLGTDMFADLSALRELDLSRTGVEVIEPGAFNGLSALQFLDFGNTSRLTTLPTGAFRGLSGLKGFVLDSTAVSTIQPGAFDGLDSLALLLIEDTQLGEWPAGAFRGMPQLDQLWLRNNPRLTTLSANSFSGLSRTLETLAVTDGALSAIEPGAFDNLAGLQLLLLGGNRLVAWPAGAFRGPSALGGLSLANNEITTVPAAAFADQPGLSFLGLTDNAIAAWPGPALEPLTKLHSLDMSGNALSELPPGALGRAASSLQRLDLRRNPGAPFGLDLQLRRVGSEVLNEGDQARLRAETARDLPAYFATTLDWTATGDVVGLGKGRANLAAGDLATEPWTLSGDNNGAAGGARVEVTADAEFVSDSIFGLEPRFADTLVLDFVADSKRTNRRPVPADSIPAVFLRPAADGAPDTVSVTLADYFTDPDGDSLVFEAVLESDVVDVSVAGDSLTLVSASPGRTSVEIRAFDPSGFVAVLDLAVTVRGQFDVEIVYLGDISPAHREIFEDAAEQWESIFVETLPDVDFSEENYTRSCGEGSPTVSDTVSDVRIFAAVGPIDGARNILARAGPCALRTGSFLPILGLMEFDEADLPFLDAQPGGFEGVVLHEMAHVLGLGTIWSDAYANLLRNPSVGTSDGPDTHFVGDLAIAAFDAAGGSGYVGAKVPVENSGRPGSADGHWRESILVTELMTPRYDTGADPLSAITIQSMADIGYVVDVSQAEPYSLPSAEQRAMADRRCAAGRCADLSNDIRRGPIVVVSPDGRVVDVIRR